MNKRALIKKIIARLTDELAVYFRAANASRAEATHEQNKAEGKYDTRGLEASYLARGQSRQAAEIESAIAEFEKLAARPLADGRKKKKKKKKKHKNKTQTSHHKTSPKNQQKKTHTNNTQKNTTHPQKYSFLLSTFLFLYFF